MIKRKKMPRGRGAGMLGRGGEELRELNGVWPLAGGRRPRGPRPSLPAGPRGPRGGGGGRQVVIEQAANKTLSLRTIDWKYIDPHDGPKMIPWGPKIETGNHSTPQLYNMQADAGEQKNLAEEHPEKVFEFQTLLRKIRNQTDKTAF